MGPSLGVVSGEVPRFYPGHRPFGTGTPRISAIEAATQSPSGIGMTPRVPAAKASRAFREASSDSRGSMMPDGPATTRSEEHTSELQSRLHLVCRLLLE